MNKRFRKLLLLFACSVLFSFITVKFAVIDSNRQFDSRITVSTELQGISEDDIENVHKETQSALAYISQILGIPSNKHTNIQIVESGICYASGETVSLSVGHVKDSSAPIIHEVTHILTNHRHNNFFSEGLAVYFQDRFGRTSSFPNFSIPLDELLKLHQNQLNSLHHLMNDNKIFEQVGTEGRRIAYIQAGSFVNFLVQKYGEQKLAELHNSRTLDFYRVFGKQLADLEKEWRNFVFGSQLTEA